MGHLAFVGLSVFKVICRKDIGYRCRCSCAKETPEFTMNPVPPGHEVSGNFVALLETLVGGKPLPEPQGHSDLHEQTLAREIVGIWRTQLRRAGCPHYLALPHQGKPTARGAR